MNSTMMLSTTSFSPQAITTSTDTFRKDPQDRDGVDTTDSFYVRQHQLEDFPSIKKSTTREEQGFCCLNNDTSAFDCESWDVSPPTENQSSEEWIKKMIPEFTSPRVFSLQKHQQAVECVTRRSDVAVPENPVAKDFKQGGIVTTLLATRKNIQYAQRCQLPAPTPINPWASDVSNFSSSIVPLFLASRLDNTVDFFHDAVLFPLADVEDTSVYPRIATADFGLRVTVLDYTIAC